MPKTSTQVYVDRQVKYYSRKGWWHCSYQTPKGRVRKALKCTTVKAARTKVAEIATAIEEGRYRSLELQEERRGRTFSDFVEIFSEQYSGWSPRTSASSKTMVARAEEHFGGMLLQDISTEQVEGWVNNLTNRRRKGQPFKPSAKRRYLAVMKTMMKAARRWGYIAFDPAEEVTSPKPQKKNPNPFTDEELQMLIECMGDKPVKQGIIVVMADTGLRKSELQELTWKDVDLEREEISLPATKNREADTLPMTSRVLAEFNRLIGERGRRGQIWKACEVDMIHLLQRRAEKMGIEGATLHRFRDSFGTRLADREVPFDRINKLLRHQTLDMTRRYTESRASGLRDAINALEGEPT